MTTTTKDKAVGADVRARLDHPVIDGDSHTQETAFAMEDFLKPVAGSEIAALWSKFRSIHTVQPLRLTFWNVPSGPASIDRAMSMLPRLRKARLEEAGLDYCVIYTTMGLALVGHRNDEFRRACCRAMNVMNADMYMAADVADRMTPAAVIPMNSPAEAIDELEYCVTELGYKTIMIPSEVRTSVKEVAEQAPELAAYTTHTHSFTLDALFDYDPFWQRCADLKVSIGCHSSPRGGGGLRGSPSNYVFNHLGSFASGAEFLCRSLFLGGVTRRFPTLRFAFLEGGVGWAADLYASIVEAWEKRNMDTLMEYLNPHNLDMDLMVEMFEKYGNDYLTPERMRGYPETHNSRLDENPDNYDDFRACEIKQKTDIRDLFVPNFYFGCEADDRLNAIAFDARLNHMDARLQATFGSDIGHWDVLDSRCVLNEAYELVEQGLMSEDDFRDFTFTNNVTLHAGVNPDFFKGTAIEAEAEAAMARLKAAQAAE